MDRVYGIVPASSGTFTFLWALSVVIVAILIAVIALFISFIYQANHLTFALTAEGLRISPGVYTRTIPRSDINTAGVKVLDLNLDKEYALKSKSNGSNLPGFSSGWFKLQNKEKALVFITDKSRIVYIPTNKDYSVLLSVREAEEFADQLQNWK